MPCFTAWAQFFCAGGIPVWTMSSPKGVQNNHMAAPAKVAKQQNTPALSGTFRNLSPESTSTRRNPPKSSGTCSCDLHRRTMELMWLKIPLAYALWEKNKKTQKRRPSTHGTFIAYRNALQIPSKNGRTSF